MDAAAPAPARDTGLPPGVLVGALGRRLVAYVVDSLIPAAAALMVVGALNGNGGGASVSLIVVAVLFAAAWALVCWQQLAIKAASPGMRLMKLQLVGFLNGRPVKWGRALLRWAVFMVLWATGLGGLLLLVSMIVNPRRQGWHDRAAAAVVIAERPLAPKRTRIRTTHTGRPSAMQTPVKPASTAPTPVRVPAPVAVTAPVAGEPALPPQPVVTPSSPAAAPAGPVPVADAEVGGEVAAAQDDRTAALPTATRPTLTTAGTNGHRAHRRIVDGWVAELDDGREIAVQGLVLLGRNPQPADGEDDATLVKVADTSRTVSKTHLAIGVDDAGLFVVDRGSTNGSTVTPPGEEPTAAGAYQAVPVSEGSVVSIGDHWVRIHRKPSSF